ncbi:MAG: hypothetical protein FJ280_00675 [Planctomycetes bacterium]|nr:hypothetical protein [Planctomycetota bacterium]
MNDIRRIVFSVRMFSMALRAHAAQTQTQSRGAVIVSLLAAVAAYSAQVAPQPPKVVAVVGAKVEVIWQSQRTTMGVGERTGPWTVMAVFRTENGTPTAVFEDFSDRAGSLIYAGTDGVRASLPKSLEPTYAAPTSLYRGHTLEEVLQSEHDLLGRELLEQGGDPEYSEVAGCFPPITTMRTQTFTFVGTRQNRDKVGFAYGGRTANFDPAVYAPQIRAVRQQRKVWDGLVGGWLPVVRFVYPDEDGNWSEMIAFAPPRLENEWIQPVWYRVCRVENGELKWVRYFDSYHPFPPRTEAAPGPFYADLEATRAYWRRMLAPAMEIEIPDQRLADMARHSLARAIITRVGAEPKYGVSDKAYAGYEHDGFPDTLNADTTAMLEWGLFGLARDYIDNYFSKFVRDDGSILYRGPETGQYGRMLTVVAAYGDYSGDTDLLLRLRRRIDAVAKLLLEMRKKALDLPRESPAFGMIAGWSEADSCLDPDPLRYMQPYFGNSTEAARGFRDLGRVWERIGKAKSDASLEEWGRTLQKEAAALRGDLRTAIERSILRGVQPPFLPGIAGVREAFPEALKRDPLDPQSRSYRTYMEMLFSGNLSREQVEMVVNYRAAHRDIILGVPAAYGYGRNEMAGFLTYGHAYGLLQHDFIPSYLLTLYSIMAHQYTRGGWVAPETRNIGLERPAAPYCTPAQLVVPMMARWMLVFEDCESDVVWLAKGTPREWLEHGKTISASGAPTRFGPVSFKLVSRLRDNRIDADLTLPETFTATVKLRCRVPGGKRIRAVTLNGRPLRQFDAVEETITLPANSSGRQLITIHLR